MQLYFGLEVCNIKKEENCKIGSVRYIVQIKEHHLNIHNPLAVPPRFIIEIHDMNDKD